MSRNDDERSRTRDDRIRARNPRDPYEAQRRVRTDEDDEASGARQGLRSRRGSGDAPWDEQPARYGGGYRGDDASGPRGARHGMDPYSERRFVEGYQDEDNRHRAHGYGRDYGQWRNEPGRDRGDHRQSNSGYDSDRSYGQGNERDDARSNARHASWTQEHDYAGPRYGEGNRQSPPGRGDAGSQHAHTDTYGGAGFRQQGKRYWFDEGDQRGRFRGTQPRGYERSDDRLRELACERLTDADIDASDIEVKVSQGTVTLEGSVPVRWMKHATEDLIDDLGGVRDIQNRLRVGRGTPGESQATSGSASPVAGGAQAAPGASPNADDIGGHSRH
jgi:hypothetical protein